MTTNAEMSAVQRNARVTALKRAAKAVLTVGDGRGFVIEPNPKRSEERYVITAGHCLPHLPPSMTFSYTHERTYRELIGPLGKKPTVLMECLFVDPCADIAVLGPPDGQVYYDEYVAYEELIENTGALRIGELPYRKSRRYLQPPHLQKESEVWLLKLNGRWMRAGATPTLSALHLSSCSIEGGMSGSPIITADGAAVGVVSAGSGWWTSLLIAHLPGWLLRSRRDYR